MAGGVILPPADGGGQLFADFWGGGAAHQEVFGPVDLGRLGQDCRAALGHQQIDSHTKVWIGGDARISVRPAALQGQHEFRRQGYGALSLVYLGEHLDDGAKACLDRLGRATDLLNRQGTKGGVLLSEVFRHCVPKGLISANFAEAVIVKPRPRDLAYANRPWTGSERAMVLGLAPAHIRVALALMANTGPDPSDALHLRRDAIANGVIWARRGKTGQEVPLPIAPTLQAAFDAAPKYDALTVLANKSGLPWTYNGFSTVWHRFKAKQVEAGKIPADLTMKGLRHTVATILREAGVHPREIADLLGQKTESMAQHYSRNARMADSNRKTIETLEAETERRTKVVKPFPKSVKP